MFNTRFVVSFLLFYTKIWFHLFCTDRRDGSSRHFFAYLDFTVYHKEVQRSPKPSPDTSVPGEGFGFFSIAQRCVGCISGLLNAMMIVTSFNRPAACDALPIV